ncbi:MAG: cupin domain-containing protein [Actinomycetota bacterium]
MTEVPFPEKLVSPPPGRIRREDVVWKLWGDEASGRVSDEIWVANESIQQMLFTMAPGARFGHSEGHRTNLGADELYFVLSGTLVLANPETGEVHRVRTGEAVAFGRDTWHHGFSLGPEPLRVMEYFAPTPAMGASQAHAKGTPNLTAIRYGQEQFLGRWPAAADEAREKFSMRVLRDADVLWRLEGEPEPTLVGIYLSTDQLTAGVQELRPAQIGATHRHGGDEAGYVVSGTLHVHFTEYGGPGPGNGWYEIPTGEGFLVPKGTPHRYYNLGAEPARFLFGVAPSYLP